MRARELAVAGCVEFTPTVFPDDRGLFVAPFQEPGFVDAIGHRLFPVAQTNYGKSRRGVMRGLHFTRTPPGGAKYVYCPRGRALDIAVDIRVGSPSYGRWDAVVLDGDDFRAVYIPIGVGHAFVALEDDTLLTYMTSAPYVPKDEIGLFAFDPALRLPIPTDIEVKVSDRDRLAPTLAEARDLGILPLFDDCLAAEHDLFHCGD
ncbi:MAG TPA: dTDP-4-dehydrorhamnose 3,5-epimerase [Actinophytocola sp.]|uniref:dTDP-4-dehydrorhamnose 3,5-epimerase family protein n=1 Tax=Actinophytocola sp. TaxID=1872138 RepID=UPI002DC02323|nr:dTDP-4-dehydrorhamnose 3,5-epimerase [Actinophytocola sp.]HEU5471633.1 dTDP-4-dehydrorhamnose 3,5-epimerase [Actinophytocola sp.]